MTLLEEMRQRADEPGYADSDKIKILLQVIAEYQAHHAELCTDYFECELYESNQKR